MNTSDLKKSRTPVLFLASVLVGGVVASEIFRRKIEPKIMITDTGITTSAFVEKYKINQKRSGLGDLKALKFMQSANRRLREIYNESQLGNDGARRLLLELSRWGVTETDYLK
jgi:hypothetical protein